MIGTNRWSRAALIASLASLASATAVAGERPWTSDDVLRLKVVSDPRVSPDGRAVAYVVDRCHWQYCKLAPAQIADRILRSAGSAGTNLAYLENTVRHLDELGIAEGPLHDLLRLTAKRRPRAADHG